MRITGALDAAIVLEGWLADGIAREHGEGSEGEEGKSV